MYTKYWGSISSSVPSTSRFGVGGDRPLQPHPQVSTCRRAWRPCFATQYQTCKTKTKTDSLVSDRSCPETDGLRPPPYRPLYAPALNRRGHKAMMLSDVCLSDVYLSRYRAYKSRTERARKTKIGTEVGNVTHDSDTTFKIKRSKVKVTMPLYSTPC